MTRLPPTPHPKFKALTGRQPQVVSSIRGRSADAKLSTNHSPPINSTGAGHWGKTADFRCIPVGAFVLVSQLRPYRYSALIYTHYNNTNTVKLNNVKVVCQLLCLRQKTEPPSLKSNSTSKNTAARSVLKSN